MNKNIFSNTKKEKSPKGFYAALGISALMIGSACWFSYSNGDKNNKSPKQNNFTYEEPVNKKITDVPKTTTQPVTTAFASTTRPKITLPPLQTSPAVTEPKPVAAQPPKTAKISENHKAFKAPLIDTSNIIGLFSGNELVKNTTTGSWQTHNGADIAAAVGDSVFAICDGRVSDISDDALWGTVVTIDHENGCISRYCGLSKELSVQKDAVVNAGDTIGAVGETADIESSLPVHLHIEVKKDGKFINPLELFS